MILAAHIILGILICIPVGPLNVYAFRMTLNRGKRAALMLSLGGSFLDVVYYYVFLSGLEKFNWDIPSYLTKPLSYSLIGIIFVLGLKDFLRPTRVDLNNDKYNKSYAHYLGYFALGAVIYGSNPVLLVTMGSLSAWSRLNFFIHDTADIIAASVGVGVGTYLWFVFIIAMTLKYRQQLAVHLQAITRGSGLLMMILSLIMVFLMEEKG